MGEGFVDVVELHALRHVVFINRLQTGDVSQKRWSREAAEDENRITSLQAAELELAAVFVVGGEIGHGIADSWSPGLEPLTPRLHKIIFRSAGLSETQR